MGPFFRYEFLEHSCFFASIQGLNSCTALFSPVGLEVVFSRPSQKAWLFFFLLGTSGILGCASELPETDSPGARLYIEACGSCHAPIPPKALTFASWEFQVRRMDEFRLARGWGPLPTSQRTGVLNYLRQHSG
ncbi:MAG TPA: hypothetical protein DCG06_08155 [Deltaproteobacteria bacterium]|nr:hypothetical protein [Deltaproteobacteria bacterium]